jgi:hypothetical protein|tara:strand:+ start:2463 stop:3590 length:1128 start_codon:yes stop_codon:yes gene_type:complete
MRYQELLETKQLGRAFNHLEDLVFFYGSDGTIEALEHLKDIATDSGSQSIRMKWDGNPQIYWGRERKGGPLILAGHNAWSKGVAATSQEEVADFISNKSGNPKTPEEKTARDQFAQKFASMYDYFDRATPRDFVGFVYADGLFLDPPEQKDGVYTFCPNPNSQTCYHVKANSDLGKRIDRATIMIVGHAFFPQFGMPDSSQQPMQDFSMFDNDPSIVVLGPVYNSKPVEVNTGAIDRVENFVSQNKAAIDGFLAGVPGLADLKNIIYTYVNQTAKAKRLDSLSAKDFSAWLQNSKVSVGKQAKIAEIDLQYKGATSAIFELVKMIQRMKDEVIDQVEGEQGDIWDTNGEGRVRYADPNKKFGNVKLVPRKRWTPA